ncbi:MAG: 2-iminoacetate synthase ThiH [Thermodesulfobacteriota bacterium]
MKTSSKHSPFTKTLASWPETRIRGLIAGATDSDVTRALGREVLHPEDLAALLSPAAAARLEETARLAHRQTRRQFGRTIGLYVPIYLSNVCASDCTYCSYAFHSGREGERRTLTPAEIRTECETLAGHGFQNVLLLTGDHPQAAPVDYLVLAVAIAREYFASVSVEIYALKEEDYRRLVDTGLEGVTLYMETYHRATYDQVHLKGRKKDFAARLGAMEAAGHAGVRRLSIGALLGLYDWRLDGFWTALHARYLQKECWRSAVAVSFPRLFNVPARHTIAHPLSDKELVQLMLALRLFLPEAGFNLSTRERPALRDRLIHLGVTMMSAGSSTRPGGYSHLGDRALEQFATEDRRSPEEVAAAIRRAGYDPVWKDFDRAFVE